MEQMVKKVAFLVADGFEDSEMKNPYEAISKNGNDAVIISLQKGSVLKGKQGTISYTSHLSAEEAVADDYEAVIIPGGESPSKLLENKHMIKFVQEADEAGGRFVDKEVVVDRNMITSRTPEDEPAFIEEIINKLGVSAY